MRVIAIVLCLACCVRADIVGYAGGAEPPGLYRINSTVGSASFLTSVQPLLTTGGLAHLDGMFYATNYTPQPGSVPANTYGRLNITNGAFTPVGTQTSQNWSGLTANHTEGVMYVMDNGSILRKVVPGGAITQIGTGLGMSIPNGIRGMAYDNQHGVLYATDYYDADANLYTISTTTGLATLVGSLGFPATQFGGVIPLAYDVDTQTLYAAESVLRRFYRVNVSTGLATPIGTLGVPMGSMVWFVPEPTMGWLGVVGVLLARRLPKTRL